jgi:glycosyltransferase involved in cell wall biosynthesis
MNIGFLVNTCEPFYRGGYEQRVATLARACARRGCRVRIFTSCPRNETIEGVEYVRIAPMRPFFNSRGVRNVWADLLFVVHIIALFFTWRKKEVEVLDVCATPFVHLPWVAWLCGWKQIPVVATCHEALLASLADYAAERGHGGFVALSVALFGAIYRFGTGSIRHRIAVSEKTRLGLEQEGFPAEALIEAGLEPHYFGPEPSASASERGAQVRFIFCGRLTPIKQVAASLEALISIRKKRNNFNFQIVGLGSEEERLKSMVRSAGAQDWVTFHGQVSESDKLKLFQASDAFILSSPREGFSIATLEAMANGCLAVILNNPTRPNGALDYVTDGESGVAGEASLAGLTAALEKVLEMGDEERLRYRKAAWTAARRYQIDEKAAALLTYFSKLTRC